MRPGPRAPAGQASTTPSGGFLKEGQVHMANTPKDILKMIEDKEIEWVLSLIHI